MKPSCQSTRPRQRGRMRLLLGKKYFCLRRYAGWFLQRDKFALARSPHSLAYSHFKHQSVLLRQLKDVDMQLQYNKITNLRLAIAKLDGVLLRPGETFSFWRLVGKPTRSKGYLDGLMLENGRIKSGVGGGLCQLANLLYWMALHSPLQVRERWHHGYDVFPDVNRSIPFGCGASLSWNYVDLQLFNPSEQCFQLRLWLDESFLHGELFAQQPPECRYEVYEKNHRILQQFWGGFSRHNEIWRRICSLDGSVLEERLLACNNALMCYNPLLEYQPS